MSEFPRNVTVSVSDLTHVPPVDLFLPRPTGAYQLNGSNVAPTDSPMTFQWTAVPATGDYYLYAETTDKNGNTAMGDRISVIVGL